MNRFALLRRGRGFSLVELMVALTIGLIITAAVAVLFVNTERSYKSQDNTARIQENGRFALNYLIRDIRMAGYLGCQSARADADIRAHKPNIVLNGMPATGTVPYPFNLAVPLEGYDGNQAMTKWAPSGSALPAGVIAGTDMIMVRMTDASSQTVLSGAMPNAWSAIPVVSVANYKPDDLVLITDCASMDLLQITDTTSSPPTLVHATGSSGSNPFAPGNTKATLSKAYGSTETEIDDMRAVKVLKQVTRRYYVRNNPSGIPSLFMDENGGAATELVEGIEDLQILYGVDDNTLTPGVDHYVHANEVTDWSHVLSVRIGVLARTPGTTEAEFDTNTYQVLDQARTFTAADKDRNRRRVFVATILVRNSGLTL